VSNQEIVDLKEMVQTNHTQMNQQSNSTSLAFTKDHNQMTLAGFFTLQLIFILRGRQVGRSPVSQARYAGGGRTGRGGRRGTRRGRGGRWG
jgi:hypothetical protein